MNRKLSWPWILHNFNELRLNNFAKFTKSFVKADVIKSKMTFDCCYTISILNVIGLFGSKTRNHLNIKLPMNNLVIFVFYNIIYYLPFAEYGNICFKWSWPVKMPLTVLMLILLNLSNLVFLQKDYLDQEFWPYSPGNHCTFYRF